MKSLSPSAQALRSSQERTFGELLKGVMATRGLSGYRLCQLTAIGAETISRLVTETRKPTEAQVLRIALALGLGLHEANHLLDAAELYVIPEHVPEARPTGRSGWPAHRPELKKIDSTSMSKAGQGALPSAHELLR